MWMVVWFSGGFAHLSPGWLLNGPAAVPLSTLKASPGTMLGIPVESASVGAITVG